MKLIVKTLLIGLVVLISSCGIYNFRGANIPDDVQTFSVGFFSNEASYVNPSLAVDLTEKLKTKFQTETSLNLKSEEGDYQISGVIKRYEITPAALNAQTGAAQTQFSITVTVDFTCPKHSEKDFSRDFTSSTTFNATTEFTSVESSLTQELTEIIVQQIFAAIALDW
jgi:outer membrane lipopolysaccharide assembly protein LptE/RlpB